MPENGVRIEHAWSEDGVARAFTTVVRSAPASYRVTTGREVVNRSVVMEPVRTDGLRWRDNDPPVTVPSVPDQQLLDEALRDEMRALLKAIDADPKAGLPKAAASSMEWLAGGAKQAQAMFATRYPIPTKALDPAANPFKDDTGRAASEAILAGDDAYAKLKILESVRAAGLKALPEAVIKSLTDPSSQVRLAALLAVRESRDLRAIDTLNVMVRDDPKAWLREEAASVLTLWKR
jgi:hypothetical protein